MTPLVHQFQQRNLEAVFEHYGLPPLRLVTVYEDRCEWEPTLAWLDRMRELLWARKFRNWDQVSNHGVTASYGYRENVPRWSMQIVVKGRGRPGSDLRIEADIDSWNPDYGVFPLAAHGLLDVTLKRFRKLDPLTVREGLRQRGILIGERK